MDVIQRFIKPQPIVWLLSAMILAGLPVITPAIDYGPNKYTGQNPALKPTGCRGLKCASLQIKNQTEVPLQVVVKIEPKPGNSNNTQPATLVPGPPIPPFRSRMYNNMLPEGEAQLEFYPVEPRPRFENPYKVKVPIKVYQNKQVVHIIEKEGQTSERVIFRNFITLPETYRITLTDQDFSS